MHEWTPAELQQPVFGMPNVPLPVEELRTPANNSIVFDFASTPAPVHPTAKTIQPGTPTLPHG